MTTYISIETALRLLANAYLLSAVLLIAFSYIGLAVLETIEITSDNSNSSLPKWFP